MTTPQGAVESGTAGSRSMYLPGLLGRPLADHDGQVLGLSGWHRVVRTPGTGHAGTISVRPGVRRARRTP